MVLLFSFYLYVYVPPQIYVYYCVQAPMEARRGGWIPVNKVTGDCVLSVSVRN